MTAASTSPILTQGGSSFDWPTAKYDVDVEIQNRTVTAHHQLNDAPQLQALIDAGDAAWALEVRCPRTLYAAVERSREPIVRHTWPANATNGALWILPGLVSIKSCELDPSGLNELWGEAPIPIPPGRWLVRANPTRTESLAASLLSFKFDSLLPDGEMRVEYQTSTGDLQFIVSVSPNHFEHEIRSNRNVQIAALIAALGRIPHIDSGDGEEFAILSHVKAYLQERDIPIWGDGINEDYDPARAATAIEPFIVPQNGDDAQ